MDRAGSLTDRLQGRPVDLGSGGLGGIPDEPPNDMPKFERPPRTNHQSPESKPSGKGRLLQVRTRTSTHSLPVTLRGPERGSYSFFYRQAQASYGEVRDFSRLQSCYWLTFKFEHSAELDWFPPFFQTTQNLIGSLPLGQTTTGHALAGSGNGGGRSFLCSCEYTW